MKPAVQRWPGDMPGRADVRVDVEPLSFHLTPPREEAAPDAAVERNPKALSPRQQRLAACDACPNKKPTYSGRRHFMDRCGVCGCNLQALSVIPGQCPIGNW